MEISSVKVLAVILKVICAVQFTVFNAVQYNKNIFIKKPQGGCNNRCWNEYFRGLQFDRFLKGILTFFYGDS